MTKFTMKRLFLELICIAFLSKGILGEDLPCAKQTTEYGYICVCNSSYCDTVERPTSLSRGKYYQYVTSQDNPGFTRHSGSFKERREEKIDVNKTVVFTIDSTTQYQEIVGFGASFTDSAGMAVISLPEEAQAKFMESYFSKKGLEHSMARVPIGCSDFSARLYTYDDDEDDDQLSNFALADEDFLYKIPLIQKAMSTSPHDFKLIGCPFTPPKWMKVNNAYSTGYIKTESQAVWALYQIKFLDAYADNGINFWAITGGNEVALPYFVGGSFPINYLALPDYQRFWLKNYLLPQLLASNHSSVKFAPMDDMRPFANYYMSRFAEDSESFEQVVGIGLHWYYDWFVPATMADDFHESFPDKMILYTESSANNIIFGGEYIEMGSWHRGALYIYNIIENLNHWTNCYLDWNMALNTNGGPYHELPLDAAVIVNKTSGEFYKSPMFYAIGHFSKFLQPGSNRIDVQSNLNQTVFASTNSKSNVELSQLLLSHRLSMKERLEETGDYTSTTPQTVLPTFPDLPEVDIPTTVSCVAALNPDNSTSVILFNSMDNEVEVRIEDKRVGYIKAKLAAQSVNTFVYWPNKTEINQRSL